jgi:hypothetical protein
MSPENRQVTPNSDGSVEIRTPATFYLPPNVLAGQGAAPPMGGGQPNDPTTCTFTAHQNVCVGGEVCTTIRTDCTASVKCLGGGIGRTCDNGSVVQECCFKFFKNLCVEVEVTISADAHCNITDVVCGDTAEGPC